MGRETEREKKKTVEMGPLVSKTTPPISPRIQSFTTDSLKKQSLHTEMKKRKERKQKENKNIYKTTQCPMGILKFALKHTCCNVIKGN